jgi:hypothetical protein
MDSFGDVFTELTQLLNNLIQIEEELLINNQQLKELKFQDNLKQTLPLSCDWALYKFKALKEVQKKMDFTKKPLNESETSLVAIESLIAFGHFLDEQCATFHFNQPTKRFTFGESRAEALNSSSSHDLKLPVTPEKQRKSVSPFEVLKTGSSLENVSYMPSRNGIENNSFVACSNGTKSSYLPLDAVNDNNSMANFVNSDLMRFAAEIIQSDANDTGSKFSQMPAYIVADTSSFKQTPGPRL